MSWMKRPQGGAPPPPGPQRQPYPVPQPQPQPQPIGNQQNMYPNYQGGAAGSTQQQQYWQTPAQPQAQYNQQYQQQDYPANANQFYQQPNQYNQNYTNQGYSGPPQSYPQNYYDNQGQQQNFTRKPNDGWEDNWDWGWEDSSKQGQKPPQNAVQNMVQQPPLPQQHVSNNANIIEESFATTDSWSWAMDDKKGAKPEPATVPLVLENKEPPTLPVSNPIMENNTVPELCAQRSASNMSVQHTEEVRTLNDKEVVKECLPNLALGKRFHLDNLTPQWSIESQMSQESSDGPHTHSEGTFRSENLSRNSSKSSPGLNTDNSNFNYTQAGLEEGYPQNSEWSRPSDELTLSDTIQSNSRRESHDELTSSLQEMNITNHENPSTDSVPVSHERMSRDDQDNVSLAQPPTSVSPARFPPPVTPNLPPPSMSSMMPPPPPVSSAIMPPSSISSVTLSAAQSASLPPPNIPPQSSNQNPFKHAGPFSHKSIAKGAPTASVMSVQSFPLQSPGTNLTSPSAVTNVSQPNRTPVGFEANLETTPDNSERPDHPQASAFQPTPVSHQVPDNMEVAPRNDRNEYLQTAHLSGGDYGENTDFSRSVPPPGLRRMVVGQQESEYNQTLNISGDEPPPGLSRMVPGQQTEAETAYDQPSDYMDRHIDGRPTDGGARPYRRADGQQTADNYPQQAPSRAAERRPIHMDRMVPGEPSNDQYPQYQTQNYAGANEQRVVTGVDHDYPLPTDAGPTDVREQNVDGSDYSEQSSRNPPRGVLGAREAAGDAPPDYAAPPDEHQRELTMEGENLQDLSIISSTELAYSREQVLDGADLTLTDGAADRKTDLSDSAEHPATSSRRQSLNRVNTSGEDSERDRAFKASPRRDRDRHKSSRDRDRERDRDRDKEGRYPREDRKNDHEERRGGREERRPEKDRRDRDRDRDGYRERRDRDRNRDESPDARRTRRTTRSHRYETEDTDYSDRERDRRRRREGSYTSSKPPRPDDKDRRYEERERGKRYATVERERRYDDERDGRWGDRDRDRYERSYRDIDPTRKYGNLRRQKDKDLRDRRVVTFSSDAKTNDSCMNEGEPFSSPSRAESREAAATDEDSAEVRRRADRRRDRLDRHDRHDRHARTAEPFYDEYATSSGAYADPYLAQRQQYQYYEHLRLTDPAAYMRVYKQLMAGHAPPVPRDYRAHLYADDFSSLGYDSRREERGSVHSGRSSTTGLKGNDTYYGAYRLDAAAAAVAAASGSLRDAPSVRTDFSDRDLTTDMSLNLHLEESTVRSERMTPFRFSTAHIKGSITSRDVVVVRPSYPVDGVPATVHVLSLAAALAHDPHAAELAAFPGPLVKGVSHKKSVIEYCGARAQCAAREGARDPLGYGLLWDLLALMLRQNGVVVGTDIAELLMKNTRDYEYKTTQTNSHNESVRGSSLSGEGGSPPPDQLAAAAAAAAAAQRECASPDAQAQAQAAAQAAAAEGAALDRLREYLIYGNKQEALEWAMSNKLWGHALQLAAYSDRRTRAGVSARFLAAQPRADPLHSLYAALAAHTPPAATCVSDERWGDWRPHAAILLANPTPRPDHDTRTLTQLGDSLSSRGLLYSAQFCYVSAGVGIARHPLAPLGATPAGSGAPPRLALLLADSRADTLHHLATNRAIFATEVYEYALSLSQEHFAISELQVYKLLVACRLVDCGQYERALAYTEAAARAVTRDPRDYSPQLVQRLAQLADRLKYHDPALSEQPPPEEGDSGEPSPRHHQQWLEDVKGVAHMLTAESACASQLATPQHALYYAQHQYGWSEQAQQYQQQPVPTYVEPVEESGEYPAQYYAPPVPVPAAAAEPAPLPPAAAAPAAAPVPAPQHYAADEWPRQEDHAHTYADPYWHAPSAAQHNYGYGEAGTGVGVGVGAEAEAADEPRPAITMPGATQPRTAYTDYDDDRPPSADQQTDRETDTPKSDGGGKKQNKGKDGSKGEGKGRGGGGGGGGWLGGILTKLSLRPPNQMILPDDKNPAIVWDAQNKRWRNVDGDSDESEQPPPPPPKLADLPHAHAHAHQGAGSPQTAAMPAAGVPPPVSNIFKMQKGRHIKKSYVDVFNPSGAATRPLPPAAEVLGPAAPLAAAPHYFVPQHQHHHHQHNTQSGMYDPTQLAAADDDEQFRSGI